MALFQRRRDEATLSAAVPATESPAAKDAIQRHQMAAAERLGRHTDASRIRGEINQRRRDNGRPAI